MAAAFEVEGLIAGWGNTRVIEEVSFALAAGARLAVLGRNGTGKTTLLAALVGLARREQGRIRLGERDIAALPVSGRALAGLGYVPQTRDVFPSLTVEENLRVGLKARPRSAVEKAFALFPRLKERRRSPAARLSGGEQQMLATARTLLGEPAVLLLDEPLEGLAPVICDELMLALGRIGATTVLVEQQIERALAFAEAALVLERGRIAWSGPAAGLAARPDIVERYLGVAAR